MKHLKLFFALFAMLALGVGNAWAEETELFSQTYPGNPTKFTGAYNSSFSLTKNDYTLVYANVNNGQKNDNWSVIRSGSNKNESVATITSGKIEAAISKVMINFTLVNAKSTNSLYLEVSNNSSFTSATKITATIATGNIEFTIATPLANQYYRITIDQAKGSANGFNRFDKIVFYQAVSSGDDEPVASLTANPTTIDFGTVYQGSTVPNQTVTVNFENLTGVTYSGLTTPFTATGTISNDGDKITIAADASNIEEYSQTLTIAAADKSVDVIVKMNVVEKPAPTGTFTLHTGALVEGDYVIVSTNSLKAEVNSDRLASLPVTISNDEIVDPDATTIWHIAKSGEYWTLYNANKAKYAASTGAKNKAALLGDATDDKALWSVTGTSTYEFVNKKNTANSVNANLRYNSGNAENSRWACYSTSTGAALSLYRKAGTKYNVNISATTNGTVTASPTSAEAGTTITLTVTPETDYVLDALTVTDASSNTVTVTNNEFTMPASDVKVTATFKENEKPAATLTLSKNGVTEKYDKKLGDVVTLPSITSDCVKEFVGWSANPTCNVAPEYKAGEEYTLAATAQTLYAVYATAGAGETLTITPSAVNNDAENDIHTFTIDAAGYSLTAKKNGGSSAPTINASAKDVRIYAKGTVTLTAPKALNTIVFNISTQGKKRLAPITASVGTIATQASGDATVTWTGDATEVTFTVGDIAEFGSENTKAGQLCFGTITVTTAGSYSDYSTTCSAALANPTFSLAAGKYTEAKSVTISAAEGTIYYTTDGTEPTASSTQYTGAIALNDCGEYTIKAIAISSDSQSDVVSATYTIKLPLTNSQAAPYTEAEAIAVYNGDCYDNQDVYVKGTVKTATFYNSGTYTITLTNGFQFYKFYKDGSKTLFTDGEINVGDVLVACGKLSKYNTTYQLAEGCYLVEHEPYTEPKTDISNTEATAYTVDKAFELIADVKSDLDKEVYVKGLVAVAPTSNPTADGQMTYSISDNGEKTGNVLKVYLGLNLNGEKFTSKNDVQQGDYVVVKGKLLDYNSTYELNKGNQLVQHVKAATISIADITMEVGETKTIAATITPADAAVTYTIKENAVNAISLSGNTITANSVGPATITATIATTADYMGKTVDFTVTVNAKSTKEKVVILAEYEGQWYAMKAQYVTGRTSHLAPLPVTYFDGKLYNVNEADKALIEWERTIVDGKATFSNNSKYLTGKSGDTDLTLAATACEWTISEDSYLIGARTFLYNAENNWFRNFGTGNAGDKNYSDMPTVTAPVYVNLNTASVKTVENAYFSVGNNKYVQFSTGNLQYEVGTNTWSFASKQYEVIGGATYDPANPTNTNYGMNEPGYTGKLDLFGWSSDGKFGVNPSNTDADYGTDGDNEFVDWGTLVNETGWYTLTKEQMNHILARTKDGKKLWALATVCGMNGLILLPDNWNTSITLDYGYIPANFNYTKNQIDDATWLTLEAAGAVFLPEGGTRVGGHGNKEQGGGPDEFDAHRDYFHVDNVNEMGYYWLNTQDTRDDYQNCASFLILPGWSDNGTPNDESDDKAHAPQVWSREKRRGNSVRLVKEVTPNYTREGQGAGVYGTVCYPENIVWCDGATLYEVAGKEGNKVIFDEVTTPEAGMPYIFIAEQEKVNFFCGSATATEAGEHNSLQGTFTEIAPAVDNVLVGNYMLVNNIIKKCGINCGLKANRAYFVATELEGLETPQSQMPGRRRISLDVTSENTTTGLDNITNGEDTTIKVIENGQLIIIRNGEKYNAMGVKL